METATQEVKDVKNEAFWKHHYEIVTSTGIRRSDYCRQHNLSYHRFGYWISRWNRFKENNNELVSIRIKSEEPASDIKTLCTLKLNNGHCLKIHDAAALEIILERYR